ncbi:sugar transferase [Halobacteriovorax marinus]|uniref:sugar transferase n=1 Tax=Halobacteriovorax marinus TaxID=97084 RepID=UPI001C12BC69|nr:sugar transferase [Halobacteriovorax marinus]
MKRLFDILFSLVGIVLLFPLMLFVGMLIFFTSGRPVFFIQKRVTQWGRLFSIIKFRTMSNVYDKDKVGIQVSSSSSFITPVGRILRKLKLDELPQLFNILLGDMSFVGPRPELPRRLVFYTSKEMDVFSVKSGITSPASICFSDEEYLMEEVSSPEEFYIKKILPLKADMNLDYIERRSFSFDLLIIWKTIEKVFLPRFSSNDNIISKDLIERKVMLNR